jgi:hypothetical protein
MAAKNLEFGANLDEETLSALLWQANRYTRRDYQVLKQIPKSARKLFTQAIQYLRAKSGKSLKDTLSELADEKWSPGQHEVLAGFFKDLRKEHEERNAPHKLQAMKWRVDVALSTNSVAKVLRPEVRIELNTSDGCCNMSMSVHEFQELRRKTASLLKDMYSLDQFVFIKNIK